MSELGEDPFCLPANGQRSGFAQPYPVTVGRRTAVPATQRGDVPLLTVPSFPVQGRTWSINVQVAQDLTPNGGVGPGNAPLAFEWLGILVRWTQGSVQLRAELDLPAGGLACALQCDSLTVYARNFAPDPLPPLPPPLTTFDVDLLCTVGFSGGARPTARPRRTVGYGVIARTNNTTRAVPLMAQRVALQAGFDGIAHAQCLDFLGTVVGGLQQTDNHMSDLPQGTAFLRITNNGGADVPFWAVYELGL